MRCSNRNPAWMSFVLKPMSFGALGLLLAASSFAAAPTLESVLTRMDTAASNWQGMRAKVEWVRYTSLVDDKNSESGKIVVRRSKSGNVAMLIEFEQPNHYYLSVNGTKVEIYKPKIKTVEEYNLSKSRKKLESALLLGFGTAGKYLLEHYDISVVGDEQIAGHSSIKLDLQPQDSKAEMNNRHLEMWISTTNWQVVQQKVYDISPGDYRLYSYSDIEINPSFKISEFKFNLLSGTKRVHPQR